MTKLVDVAEHLNLSKITVSAVLNNRHRSLGISEKTAERVRKAAVELGYQQNQLAVAMRTGKTFSLGCVIEEKRPQQWIAETLIGALRKLLQSKYSLKIEEVSALGGAVDTLDRFAAQRVQGIIGVNLRCARDGAHVFRQALERYKIPMVATNCAPDLSAVRADADNGEGIRQAVGHLVELGHRRIGFVGGGDGDSGALERKLGFITCLSEFGLGLGPGHLQECERLPDEAELAAFRMLEDRTAAPSAVVAASDIVAATTIRIARRLGYRLPEDLSVVGFSNTEASICSDPQLTSIDLHHDDVGEKAAEMLIDLVEREGSSPDMGAANTVTSVEIVLRGSTSPPGQPSPFLRPIGGS